MDQSKTNLPYLIQCTKSTQNLWNLRTHLTGALLHTQSPKGKLAFGYYDLLQWPHDCNLTLNIFLQVLQELTAKSCTLPKILYMNRITVIEKIKIGTFWAFVLFWCS